MAAEQESSAGGVEKSSGLGPTDPAAGSDSGSDPRSDPRAAALSPPASPPKKGLSGGAKLFLGCLGLFVIMSIVAAVTLGAGAIFVGKAAKDVVSGVRGDGASGDLLKELEARHPFQAPADGVVGEERARRFATAADAVWTRLEPRAEALNEAAGGTGEPAGVRDALSQMRSGLQGLEGLRQALAEGLAEARMPLQEFLWTASQLTAGYRALGMASRPESVPEANLETARRHGVTVANLVGGPDQREDRTGVMTVAMSAGGLLALGEIMTR
jgi:hypothetical protein